ncbi:16S rRNA (guanine(966)-N(2))-methyltransferase RsmD [Limobrevibacterium gyesilva]|uniref:16S rRNA (Guanine(966)-N(2))-methyltransferase RsmD n=1 Tax=Limobrevibacterium gyesilva TaxID=2991712 RepID=A0AA41YJC4_9PROT|nr:16S rRNA (guanine(966)-N(2))-methyltransferase RsmD [Limobrevibacterium gyesilva]MCW3473321.1 16S rRNA (guanine(966)-N(2))-methyltransferase RsmD [Limobrevibacterium gyesilva]
MRIVAGTWRGRLLTSPPGLGTRPTADRVRQALFDMLLHAPWGGRALLEAARVLDAFAGTGALGLEALSRGAAHVTFMEREKAALGALRENIARCKATDQATVLATDATQPPPGKACSLIFLDPPYGQDLGPRAVTALRRTGWLASDAIIVLETGREEAAPEIGELLASRSHGAAQVTVWRNAARPG